MHLITLFCLNWGFLQSWTCFIVCKPILSDFSNPVVICFQSDRTIVVMVAGFRILLFLLNCVCHLVINVVFENFSNCLFFIFYFIITWLFKNYFFFCFLLFTLVVWKLTVVGNWCVMVIMAKWSLSQNNGSQWILCCFQEHMDQILNQANLKSKFLVMLPTFALCFKS